MNPAPEKVEVVKNELCILYKLHGFPEDAKALGRYARVVSRFVEVEEVDHDVLGKIVPLEWLIDKILETCQFFPSPLRIRQLYEQSFRPLDGKSSAELEEIR